MTSTSGEARRGAKSAIPGAQRGHSGDRDWLRLPSLAAVEAYQRPHMGLTTLPAGNRDRSDRCDRYTGAEDALAGVVYAN